MLALAACGGSSEAPTVAPSPVPAGGHPGVPPQPPMPTGPPKPEALKGPPMPGPVAFRTRAARDPFVPAPEPSQGAQDAALASARLTGVLRGPQGLRVLVETGDGRGWALKVGDRLGAGRLVSVDGNTAVFALASAERLVLRIPRD